MIFFLRDWAFFFYYCAQQATAQDIHWRGVGVGGGIVVMPILLEYYKPGLSA